MKKIVLLFFLILSLRAGAQSPLSESMPVYNKAQMLLDANNIANDPKKAIELFIQEAEKGDARSMNALGVIYSKGIGTRIDPERAISWFEKAAHHNYAAAWYNLGLIYKDGIDVPQDFAKAFGSFSNGSKLKSSACTYSLGYLKFKGLGCKQSYEEAILLFRKSIASGSLGSMYMLGICFRNGYGITANIDSAKYWIERAASKGYVYAEKEMQEVEPENNSIAKNQIGKELGEKKIGSGQTEFLTIKHHVEPGNISGIYEGYLIKYDWSGKNVIGQSKLLMKLNGDQKTLTGEWIEDDKVAADIQGELTDTAFVFSNTKYERIDHYSAKKPAVFEFRKAKLHVVKTGDTVFLAGTVQQFSLRQNEPEKPMYISLIRLLTEGSKFGGTKVSVLEDKNSSKIISDLIVYPNPFSHSFQINFNLKTAQRITVYLTDLMGRTIYLQQPQLGAGEQKLSINTEVQRGTYVLKIQYGKEIHSTVLIKQ